MARTILGYIAGWYVCSIALSLYNKWMFDPERGLSVPYPILVTMMQQWILWGISWVYLKSKGIEQVVEQSRQQRWKFYLKFIIPAALATAGDIGLANVSFKFITLTIYTIVKSSSIAFVLLFGCLFRTEMFHWRLACIVAVMFAGVAMMVYRPRSDGGGPADEHIVLGVMLVLGSSMLSGLRWVYTQLVLRKVDANVDPSVGEKKKKSPVETIHQLTPVMGLALLVTTLAVEKPFPAVFHSPLLQIEDHTSALSLVRGFFLLLTPGVLVFLLVVCEFGILQHAQVLTLSVAGVCKEVITILASMLVLRETLSGFQNWLGMGVILLDVCYYNFYRFSQKKGASQESSDDASEVLLQEFELESNKQIPELQKV
ncbi:Ymd8p [Lachancea thermotolerans CBS 6340]|uniref:KLTH0G05082p n=1 Tax=Lachancea thermotolerans (strain ATCC 56472 / CBS 6340 / NRRL Y-8284) TaxID=559295 RepID=C5DM11_LACTC|nr:KLTH0G05082p [Lachancea thermotolerans CBS 6340]CAR24822.1 KLTH0G05082p [Lachancea thermotolerans CBS 6340]